VIVARRLQRSFADGFIAGEVTDLWGARRADDLRPRPKSFCACCCSSVAGRRMRVDTCPLRIHEGKNNAPTGLVSVTTVVETDIHYPTDSSLMGDGVRVLTRVMKRVAAAAGAAGTKFRIARAA
jgi:hypothetical protein